MDGLFIAGTFWLSIATAVLLVMTVAIVGRIGWRRLSGRRTGNSPRPAASASPSSAARTAASSNAPPAARPAASSNAPSPTRLHRVAERSAQKGGMPKALGRYQLLEEIGSGAMGRVFLGRDPKINRVVAIKAVDLANDFDSEEAQDAGEHFLREAEAAGRLNHPHIVTIYDVGECDGIAYIAMEYLRGRRLSEFTDPETLLPPALVLDLLGRTAEALHYAHSRNVVHRDIKPANIMYDSQSNTLKLTDFGIARLIDVTRTRAGIVLGTPSFMSPEQLEGKNVNGHTDLFALGVTLFQLLTGHLPFRGTSMTKLMFVIANEPHQPVTALRAGLPTCVDALLDRALAKDPNERYRNGAEMAEALRAAAGQAA